VGLVVGDVVGTAEGIKEGVDEDAYEGMDVFFFNNAASNSNTVCFIVAISSFFSSNKLLQDAGELVGDVGGLIVGDSDGEDSVDDVGVVTTAPPPQ